MELIYNMSMFFLLRKNKEKRRMKRENRLSFVNPNLLCTMDSPCEYTCKQVDFLKRK